jgi:hypothetical protein
MARPVMVPDAANSADIPPDARLTRRSGRTRFR